MARKSCSKGREGKALLLKCILENPEGVKSELNPGHAAALNAAMEVDQLYGHLV